jgi:xanthine dehydrogenase accessory factor
MNGLGILERIGELARSGETFALATVVWRQGPSSSKEGSRAIITATGEVHGWIGGACAEPTVIREAKQVMTDGQARLLLLGSSGQFGGAVPEGMTVVPISCQSEGALEVYIEPVLPVPHLVILGSSPMSHTLAELSRALGWSTDLISPQDFTAGQASPRSMIVVATQGHGDEDMIERAAAIRPAYLGLIASRRRGEAVLGYLAERGVPKDQLDRVHAPAGLDLGKTTHEEMAVAILAELVQLRASGALTPQPAPAVDTAAVDTAAVDTAAHAAGHTAAHAAGHTAAHAAPGRKAKRELKLAEAVDPVCGMTVMANSGAMPLTHNGVTYYFCCAGCHRSFEENPDAYVKAVRR